MVIRIPHHKPEPRLDYNRNDILPLPHHAGSPAGAFTSINGSALFDWGSSLPPCAKYLSVPYVPGGTFPVKANETYMMRTNGGHIAIFTVTNFSPDIIAITWMLYTVT